jgi:hypothetical protein
MNVNDMSVITTRHTFAESGILSTEEWKGGADREVEGLWTCVALSGVGSSVQSPWVLSRLLSKSKKDVHWPWGK